MATRERPGDRGAQDARRIVRVTGAEFRERRLSLGASQAAVARAAGVSPAQEGRIERGEVRAPSLEQLCRIGRALGLAPSLRYLPTGAPVRDAGQLAVFGRFEVLLAPPLRLRREVGLPMPGDLRAWDGLIEGGAEVCFVEVEARLRDTQATARRIELKVRDDGRGRVVILVVARTAHNKAVLAEHREALRTQFPLDGPAITRSLRRGETPKASGMLVV